MQRIPVSRVFGFGTLLLAFASIGCPRASGSSCDIIRNPSCPIGGDQEIWLFAYSQSEVAEMVEHFGPDRGLIAVRRYLDPATNSVKLDIERGCHIDGGYNYTPSATQEQHVQVHSKDQLAATVPFTFGAFSAQFEQSNFMDVRFKSPGYYKAVTPAMRFNDPACAGVTDFISYVRIGAYDTTFDSSMSAGAGVAGNVPGANVGGGTSSGADSKTSVGKFEDCDRAATQPGLFDAFLPMGAAGAGGAAQPTLECAQPIQISLRPLSDIPSDANKSGPAPTAAGGSCVDDFTVANNAGYFFDKATMTFTVDFNQMAQTGNVPSKDGAQVHAFTCTNDTWVPEADAMAKIVTWVKNHPAVRVHVSVRCNAQDALIDNVFGSPVGLTAGSHMANISDVVAPLQLSKQLVGSGSCDVGSLMGSGKGLPGPSGVYIEIVSGCPEGAAHANQLICQ